MPQLTQSHTELNVSSSSFHGEYVERTVPTTILKGVSSTVAREKAEPKQVQPDLSLRTCQRNASFKFLCHPDDPALGKNELTAPRHRPTCRQAGRPSHQSLHGTHFCP
eukprot:scpid28076/ scgid9704/ 